MRRVSQTLVQRCHCVGQHFRRFNRQRCRGSLELVNLLESWLADLMHDTWKSTLKIDPPEAPENFLPHRISVWTFPIRTRSYVKLTV